MSSRREFLLQTGAFGSWLWLSPFTRFAFAETARPAGPVFVYIFARGAADGLSLLIPKQDHYYFDSRPTLKIPLTGPDAAVSLDSSFAMHPAMAALLPMWQQKQLALIPQSGSPDPTRSHFDAQDYAESGAPGKKDTTDGFLNRVLQQVNWKGSSATDVRAVALQSGLPYSLRGKVPAYSMNSIAEFKLLSNENNLLVGAGDTRDGFEKMYKQAADQVFRGAGGNAFSAIESVKKALPESKLAKNSQAFGNSKIGKSLRDIAAMIKSNIGLQIAVTEIGGFDTHVRQGAAHGQLADRLREVSESLAAFASELGPDFQRVTVCVQTEFGRTMKENGTGGTDHGHGSVMLLAGGLVRGGIYGGWKELSKANLFEERDVPVVTDFRQVLSEALRRTLGPPRLDLVFPDYKPSSEPLGLMRA